MKRLAGADKFQNLTTSGSLRRSKNFSSNDVRAKKFLIKWNKSETVKNNQVKKILIIGGGYVGLVSAVCWAKVGHKVFLLEIDPARLKALQAGTAPFFEPQLDALLSAHLQKNLFVTIDVSAAMQELPDFVFLCVGTPANPDGSADLSYVWQAVFDFCKHVKKSCILICKSTLPVGTTAKIDNFIQIFLADKKLKIKIKVVFMPEFLSQGQAIKNFFEPDRIVVGLKCQKKLSMLKKLHAPLLKKHAKFFSMNFASAELVKYTSNAMLALRISFINQIANYAEKVNGNIEQISQAVGADPRIGSQFLSAGLGFGGSCFPKDLAALVHGAAELKISVSIAEAALKGNVEQRQIFLQKILTRFKDLTGKKIGFLGLAFKVGTDDLRESPALWLVQELASCGAQILVFDPQCKKKIKNLLHAQTFQELLQQDFLVIASNFDFLHQIQPQSFLQLKDACIFDGRNCFKETFFDGLKIEYYSVGRF